MLPEKTKRNAVPADVADVMPMITRAPIPIGDLAQSAKDMPIEDVYMLAAALNKRHGRPLPMPSPATPNHAFLREEIYYLMLRLRLLHEGYGVPRDHLAIL